MVPIPKILQKSTQNFWNNPASKYSAAYIVNSHITSFMKKWWKWSRQR